jgi:prepilin-type N-terminal cleavage/methylation domain-containing protein
MHNKKGVTLVEVMVAILIFTIVMLGGLVFFFYGRTHISHSNHQRMALELAKEKMETWKADDYDNVLNENEPNIPLGGIQFSRNTVVNEVLVGGVYKEVTVTTSWQEKGNPVSVQIITIIAE